jgi:hypothetical protein
VTIGDHAKGLVGLTMQNAKTIITAAGDPLPASLARSRHI